MVHKSRQRLYELYSKKTYNHTESFSHYVSVYSKLFKKNVPCQNLYIFKNKIKNYFDKITNINNETGKL